MLLLTFFPILLVAGLIIGLLSGRSPLVAIDRVGRGGLPFAMLKLRTMWSRTGCERSRFGGLVAYMEGEFVPPVKSAGDPRIQSRFARFCRRYSIDELPQLLHVLTGAMALVGPRPLTSVELDAYYDADAVEVTQVRPGLTGLWQVMGRNRLTYPQRRRLDLFLVRHRSVLLNLWILWRTIPQVVRGMDAH